jgi:hypothetical protein
LCQDGSDGGCGRHGECGLSRGGASRCVNGPDKPCQCQE